MKNNSNLFDTFIGLPTQQHSSTAAQHHSSTASQHNNTTNLLGLFAKILIVTVLITMMKQNKMNAQISASLSTTTHTITPGLLSMNGSNTWKNGQNYTDINNSSIAINSLNMLGISSIRYAAGYKSGYINWLGANGFNFYPTSDYPKNFDLTGPPQEGTGMSIGNNYSTFLKTKGILGLSPMYTLNILTSNNDHQIAGLMQQRMMGLNINDVELGVEYYLPDHNYITRYPDVKNYIDNCQIYTDRIKEIFPSTKVCLLGAVSDKNDVGRRRMWMKSMSTILNGYPKKADAISVHIYSGNDLGAVTGCPWGYTASVWETFLRSPFKLIDKYKTEEFALIKNAGYKIWITEYSMRDASRPAHGTWAYGLYMASMTLAMLEEPEIDRLVPHTLIGDFVASAIYGDTFGLEGDGSDGKFPNCETCYGAGLAPASNKYELTAMGNALQFIGQATKNATSATKINFTNAPNFPIVDGITYPKIYGWQFANVSEKEFVILNLSIASQPVDLSGLNINFSDYELLTIDPSSASTWGPIGEDLATYVAGNATLGSTTKEIPKLTQTALTSTTISLPYYSISYVKLKSRNLRMTLSQNAVCKNPNGESTYITAKAYFGTPPYSWAISGTGITLIINGDNIITSNVNNAGVGTYTVTCTDANSISVNATFTLNASLASKTLTQTSVSNNPTTINLSVSSPGAYLYKYTSVNGAFIDQILSGNNAAASTIYNIVPYRTNDYISYYTANGCFARTNLVNVPVPTIVASKDDTTCTNTSMQSETVVLSATVSGFGGTPTYQWYKIQSGLVLIPGAINATYTLSTANANFPATTASYVVRATLNTTVRQDTVTVYVFQCCSVTIGNNVLYNRISTQKNISQFISNNNLTVQNNMAVYDGTVKPANVYVYGNVDVDVPITFKKCTLNLSENATMRIQFGQPYTKLRFEDCYIIGCNGLHYYGIVANSEISKVEVTGTGNNLMVVRDGVASFDLSREMNYQFDNVTFENNRNSIYLHDYLLAVDTVSHSSGAIADSGFIINCSFKYNSTYSNYLSMEHIKFNNNEHIIVGRPVKSTIGFSNDFGIGVNGIYGNNAGFDFVSNHFHDFTNFWNDPMVDYPQYPVYNISSFDFNDRTLKSGHTSPSTSNFIETSAGGIYSTGECNFICLNTAFGHATNSANGIAGYGINVVNPGAKLVWISNRVPNENSSFSFKNNFNYCKQGVVLQNVGNNTTFVIARNIFNKVYPITGQHLSFVGTAINITNTVAADCTNDSIFSNDIQKTRIGIHALRCNNIRIGTPYKDISALAPALPNTITLGPTTTTLYNNYNAGIWVENSDGAWLNDNTVTGPTSTSTYTYRGAEMADCPNARLRRNTFTSSTGNAVYIRNNSLQTKLYCNQMYNSPNGVILDNTTLSQQGLPGEGWGNEWNSIILSNRVVCPTGNCGFTNWYHQDISTSKFSPGPTQTTYIAPFPNQTPLADCNTPPAAAMNRDAVFGKIISDSILYPELQDENSYNAKKTAFIVLRDNDSLLTIGSPRDAEFQQFYNDIDASNMQLLDIVIPVTNDTIAIDSLSIINQAVNDTNFIEYNRKQVNEILLACEANEQQLTNNDSTMLTEIGNYNAAIAGEAAYMARAKMMMEVHDDNALGARKGETNEVENTKRDIAIFPNPATNNITVLGLNQQENKSIEISDIAGRVVLKTKLTQQVNISFLGKGVYVVNVLNGKQVIYKNNLIKL